MKLTEKGIENLTEWKNKGYICPDFNIELVKKNTVENPTWIHFGAGNIFRAFQANLVQTLLNKGVMNTGLVVAEGYDYEIIEKMYKPHDNIGILATLKTSGSVEKTIVSSIMSSLCADSENKKDFDELKRIFSKKSLQLVSFTITEKGYSLKNSAGSFAENVQEDFRNGPEKCTSYMGKVVALLYSRFVNGALPIAMVSMDNCSHNGEKLYEAVNTFAKKWEENKVVQKGFCDYVNNGKVSFPWTMIDKITPRPDKKVEEILLKDGIDELESVITTKKTYVAPFVNAEECQYLVIEDNFPNGRPNLEKAGVYFTDRQTVEKVEKMKVCTCLNPLHTVLAVFGCLLGYTLISSEMNDSDLKKLVEIVGYKEGLPVVVDPKIISPQKFIDEVVNIRIPNPFMPDTPQRIACDTSQKLAIRFGETIKAYEKRSDLDVSSLKVIPLLFAGWIRYLMAIDDSGKTFELSPDPLLADACKYVKEIKIGNNTNVEKQIKPLLLRKDIFGVDLYESGLSSKVLEYFNLMISENGAVRKTIQKVIA